MAMVQRTVNKMSFLYVRVLASWASFLLRLENHI